MIISPRTVLTTAGGLDPGQGPELIIQVMWLVSACPQALSSDIDFSPTKSLNIWYDLSVIHKHFVYINRKWHLKLMKFLHFLEPFALVSLPCQQ